MLFTISPVTLHLPTRRRPKRSCLISPLAVCLNFFRFPDSLSGFSTTFSPTFQEGKNLPIRRDLIRFPRSQFPCSKSATRVSFSFPRRVNQTRFPHCHNCLIRVLSGPEKMAASRLQMEGDDSVLLHVTHSNLKSFAADVRFSPQMNVEAVKEKLWKKCGTSVNAMALELYDESGSKVAALSDNTRPLGFYSPFDGFRLYIMDLDPSSVTTGGWLEDTSLVEKYTISEEDYAKRTDSFRKFKEKRVSQNPVASETKTKEDFMEDLCANIKVGDRCQVEPGEKRGVVKYVGRAEALGPGYWVGIQYDEPLGKHDGMVKGTRLFECPLLHGGVVRPDKVKVGDYPERDPFEEDEI